MSQAYISIKDPLQDHGFPCGVPQKNHLISTTTITKSLDIQSEVLPYDTKRNLEERSPGPTESIAMMDESRPLDISYYSPTQAQVGTTDKLQLPIKLDQFVKGGEGDLSVWSDTSPSGCEQEERSPEDGSPHSSPLKTASRSIKALFRHINHSALDEPCREMSTALSPKGSASPRRYQLPFSSLRQNSPYVGALKTRSPSLGGPGNRPGPPDFSIPADSGVGLKARRMSANVPDDFIVNTCDLSDEFTTASKVPGRRGREIAKGSTATVKIVYRKDSSKDVQYAVKEFRKCGSQEDQLEYKKKVKSEFSIANSLHHPNIVKTVRLCSYRGRWNHVMEYCSYGDLFSLVQRNYLQREDNMCLFKQLLQGVSYLHSNGIAHRDIKLENLLLSGEGHLKITDFGVSEVFSGLHPGLSAAGGQCGKEMGEVRRCPPGICGSLPYIAPEVLAKKGRHGQRPCHFHGYN